MQLLTVIPRSNLTPIFLEAYINRASANLSLDQHDAAIADCDAVLKLNPDFVQAYVIRATAKFAAEFDSDQHIAALTDYDTAIKLNPNAVEIYFARAHVRAVLDDYAGAIEDYDRMIRLNPEPNPNIQCLWTSRRCQNTLIVTMKVQSRTTT